MTAVTESRMLIAADLPSLPEPIRRAVVVLIGSPSSPPTAQASEPARPRAAKGDAASLADCGQQQAVKSRADRRP
jgi:hypothetical protein